MTATSATAPAVRGEEAATAPRKPHWLLRIPAPYWFSSLITLILVVGELRFGIVGGYDRLALALGCAMLSEIALSLLVRRKFPFLLSSYITGNSVAIMTKPLAVALWPFALGAFISICSKYVLAIKGRHLWNPTNFGISIMVLLAPNTMGVLSHQWSNSWAAVAIIYGIGFLVCWRAKVIHMSGTYLLAFAAFALLRSGFDPERFRQEISPLTGPMYSLFIFFMITDPRTVVAGRAAQVFVSIVIALADNLIRYLGDQNVAWIQPLLPAPPLFALFIVGPIALLVSFALGREKPRAN